MGESIFFETLVEEFHVSSGSSNCTAIDYVLFSSDKKTLLRYPPNRKYYDVYSLSDLEYSTMYIVPEGTEIINEDAFDRAILFSVTLPSTLRIIKDAAFWIEPRVPTRSSDFDWELEYRAIGLVVCKAVVPPLLVGRPFIVDDYARLYVPDESFESYCNASGWKEFVTINDHNLSSINNLSIKGTKVWFENFILNVTSEQRITQVYVYNQIGTLLIEQEADGNSWFWDMETLHPQGLLLIRVVYDDFTESVFKLIK